MLTRWRPVRPALPAPVLHGIALADVPLYPPHVRKPEIVFGSMAALPRYDALPSAYRAGHARGVVMADTIFYDGWAVVTDKAIALYGAQINMAAPGPSHIYLPGECREPTDRFQRCIQAHLQAWTPDRQHVLSGVGYLIDLWFGVLPREMRPDAAS